MMDVYESIMAGLNEALEYAKGERNDLRTTVLGKEQNEESCEQAILQAFKDNMEKDNIKRKKNNAPIAKYDVSKQQAYLEYPNGQCVYYR